MRDTVHLGRIAGVRIGIHWSLVVMVALLAGGLADSRFPTDAPGHSGATYAVAGLLTAVGLLLGVLLHELAHAVAARWKGLSVDGITLSWMGGVTRIEGDTGRAGTELLVAGVGPLSSAALGGIFFLARMGAGDLGAGSLILAALGWLAWINLVLAVFNLLPAAPLDGGRVLHAVVWIAGRDRWRATRVATGAGIGLGVILVGLGFLVTERNGDLFDGLVVGIIGWWLLASARAEMGSGALQQALDGVSLSQLMRPVGEAPGWITVRTFMEQYGSHRPGWVWLLQDWSGGYGGLLVGDAVASVPYPHWDLARPLDLAVPVDKLTGASPDEDALSVLSRSGDEQVILVVHDGRTVGAVLPKDVEALVRMGGRVVRGRPAHGPVSR